MEDPVDAFLAHNGVKGMHWGIRKQDPNNPKSSKELVKAARTNAKSAFNSIQDKRIERNMTNFFKEPISYASLSDKAVTINKGHELYRLSKRKDEKFRDMTYVSTNNADRQMYRATLSDPNSLRFAKKKYSDTYESVFKATTNLKSPSEKARVDAFIELLGTPSIPMGSKGKAITGREYLNRTGLKSEIKRLDNQTLGLKYYNSMVQDQFVNNKLNTAYFNLVKSKGYNSIVDDNDRNILSKQPLIILDPSNGAIKQISVTKLTNDDINKTLATLKPAV